MCGSQRCFSELTPDTSFRKININGTPKQSLQAGDRETAPSRTGLKSPHFRSSWERGEKRQTRPCDRRDLTFCRNQTENNKKKSPRAASSRSPSLLQRVSSIAATPVTQGCANEGAARLRFGVLHQLGHLGWIPAALCRGWRSTGSPLVCATRPQSTNSPGSGAGADSRSKPCGAHVLPRLCRQLRWLW